MKRNGSCLNCTVHFNWKLQWFVHRGTLFLFCRNVYRGMYFQWAYVAGFSVHDPFKAAKCYHALVWMLNQLILYSKNQNSYINETYYYAYTLSAYNFQMHIVIQTCDIPMFAGSINKKIRNVNAACANNVNYITKHLWGLYPLTL